MTAELKGEPGIFWIEPRSERRQIVVEPYTEWEWRITPLVSGTQFVDLVVTAEVEVDDKSVGSKSLPTKTARIRVRVDPWFALASFAGKYWQWLLTAGVSVVATALAFLRGRFRPRRKPAGFQV